MSKNKKSKKPNNNNKSEIQKVADDSLVQTNDEVLVENETTEEVEVQDTEKEEKTTEKENKKDKNKDKDNKKSKKNSQKNVKEKGSLKRKAKETISELKKVIWPTFGEVVKRTGIVLVVVLIFAVVIFGIDVGLGALVNLLKK